jgi:hypothetical protein
MSTALHRHHNGFVNMANTTKWYMSGQQWALFIGVDHMTASLQNMALGCCKNNQHD